VSGNSLRLSASAVKSTLGLLINFNVALLRNGIFRSVLGLEE